MLVKTGTEEPINFMLWTTWSSILRDNLSCEAPFVGLNWTAINDVDFGLMILRLVETVKLELFSNSKFAGRAKWASFRIGTTKQGVDVLTHGGNLILAGSSFFSNTGGLSHVDLNDEEWQIRNGNNHVPKQRHRKGPSKSRVASALEENVNSPLVILVLRCRFKVKPELNWSTLDDFQESLSRFEGTINSYRNKNII